MAAKKAPAKARKNPKGGLTAAGRKYFKKKEGANLKPGVKKPEAEMSTAEMKRKGSWAVRFYGREGKLPALEKDGEPTRFALTATAWGEPVPKTVAAARRIAAREGGCLPRHRGRKKRRRSKARSRNCGAPSGLAAKAVCKMPRGCHGKSRRRTQEPAHRADR